MARIRTIKPEAFLNEDLWDLAQETGLPIFQAFVGLWTQADREGRFEWKPRRLKAAILPYWDGDFTDVLEALSRHRFVAMYEVEGQTCGLIPTFHKHQVINQREAKSKLPEPPVDTLQETHVHAHAEFPHILNGENVPAGLRETVLARDGHACTRCKATERLEIDHIFPRSIGGTHAISNLRTLCKSCNCARPVQGQALIDDLAKDGYTLSDMQRTCMHVQDSGERKGKEGNKEDPPNPPPGGGADLAGPEHPPGLDVKAWNRWVEYRTKIRKPLKPVSMPAAQQKLAAMGSGQAEAVEQSIANGWQGLFPPKGGPQAIANGTTGGIEHWD